MQGIAAAIVDEGGRGLVAVEDLPLGAPPPPLGSLLFGGNCVARFNKGDFVCLSQTRPPLLTDMHICSPRQAHACCGCPAAC